MGTQLLLVNEATAPNNNGAVPTPSPFPARLWHGLGWGILARALLGLLGGLLLYQGLLVVPG